MGDPRKNRPEGQVWSMGDGALASATSQHVSEVHKIIPSILYFNNNIEVISGACSTNLRSSAPFPPAASEKLDNLDSSTLAKRELRQTFIMPGSINDLERSGSAWFIQNLNAGFGIACADRTLLPRPMADSQSFLFIKNRILYCKPTTKQRKHRFGLRKQDLSFVPSSSGTRTTKSISFLGFQESGVTFWVDVCWCWRLFNDDFCASYCLRCLGGRRCWSLVGYFVLKLRFPNRIFGGALLWLR